MLYCFFCFISYIYCYCSDSFYFVVFFLMIRRPPRSTRTDTLFPYTTLFRSAEVDALLAAAPHDPYFLELKGQVLLESGKPADAIPPLREAVQLTNQPLVATLLGHALIATENDANFAEAEKVLRNAIARDRENPFAWYQLGVVYEHRGDLPRAALATAERYSMMGEDQRSGEHTSEHQSLMRSSYGVFRLKKQHTCYTREY